VSQTTKDLLGALVVAVVSVMLVILLMGTIVLAGYGAGKSMREQIGETPAPDRVPVLSYHYLRGNGGPLRVLKVLAYVVLSLPVLDDADVWTVTADQFDKQMRWLYENGYETVSLEDVARWREGTGELPARPIVITFDDGDRSVLEHAWPVLDRYGFTATFFVVTGKVGESWKGVDNLSWAELRQMHDSGTFEIQSHTHDLHYKVSVGRGHAPVFLAGAGGEHDFEDYRSWEDALLDDLGTSRALIRRHIGVSPQFLAWPYGHGGEDVDRMAMRAGFECVVTMQGNVNRRYDDAALETLPAWQRLEIDRFPVSARTTLPLFRKVVRGENGTDEKPEPVS
jgi:peptidoglycan/xylan/chitin deacetylase (PgdA/CDA1 family)